MVVAANSGKKRANSSSASTFKKRPRIDGPKKEENSKSKGAQRAEKENISTSKVKRSKPVTVDVVDDRSEEDSEGEDFEAEENGDEGMDVDPGEDDVVVYEGTQPKSSARESHAAQRAIANERKASKPHASLLVEAKRLWSSVRQKNDISKEERQKAVKALMDCVRGKVQDIVFKHDASRIIQSIVKYGGQKERDEIALELKGKYVELCQNKYSKFLVTKLVRYSPSNRSSILSEFHGHVLRLLLHREASSTVADCYELYANAADRTALVWDLYGKEVALFATQTKKSLKDLLVDVDEARRKRVLEAVKDNILNIVNNPDKGAVTHAIFHRVILEYLTEIKSLPDEDEEKLRREIFDSCYELLAEMVHTRDGSRVVREFIAQGSAKDRKAILKTLKPHVEKMCSVDEAQVVLFTALDVIDDTKLLSKSLIQPMTSTCPQLLLPSSASAAATRRSILYLLVPRSNRHFTPAIVNTIAETDSIREKTSKKDNELRKDEIRKFASPDLLQFVVEHAKELISDPGGSLVVGEIMLYSDGDKTEASEALLDVISTPHPPPPDVKTPHPIDQSHIARVYKTLLQGGHFSKATSSVTPSPHFSASEFASLFITRVGKDTTIGMALGHGTFVVVELIERVLKGSDESAVEKGTLREWFGTEVCAKIRGSDVKGKDILLAKIDALARGS